MSDSATNHGGAAASIAIRDNYLAMARQKQDVWRNSPDHFLLR